MQALKERAANATLWSGLEIAARYGSQFVVMIFLARLLSPIDFGLIAIVLIFTSIGALLVDGGFGTALIQSQKSSDNDETTVFLFNLSVGLILAASLFFLAPHIALFFDQPQLSELTRAMAIILPMGALAGVPDALLSMRLDFKARARAEIVASIVSGCIAILLAMRGFGIWSMVWQSIISVATRGGMLWILSGWRPRGKYSTTSFRSLFAFGGYMLATGLLNTIAVRAQSLLIGRIFDARTLGYYTLAQNTQQAPSSLVGTLLNRIGFPVFSTISHDPLKLTASFKSFLGMTMFIFVPFMVGIALIAEPLVTILYGKQWAQATPILRILALGAATWPMHVLNISVISSMGKSNLLLRVEVVKQALLISLIYFSARWGVLGVAWAVLAGNLLSVVINSYYCGKLLGYGATSQLMDQAPTFSITAIAAAAGWLILQGDSASQTSFLFAAIAMALIYILLATITRNRFLPEVISAARALQKSMGKHYP